MEIGKRLLEHPFYQLWEKGEISKEQLADYSYSYFELIEDIPVLWQKAIEGLNAESESSEQLVKEEISHITLWNEFKSKQNSKDFHSMKDVREELEKMNPSELLGAIHSFEIQQPEVAKTKKEGLIKYYGFDESELKYFNEHIQEAEHIAFGKMLSEKFAIKEDFERGFVKGSEIFYKALDRFLN